jgi:protein O-GlcNAc transferase
MADFQQAVALHRAGNVQGAIAIYRTLVAADPKHFSALHLLGVALATTGRRDEALEPMRRSLRAKPANPEYFGNYAHLLFTMGRHAEALDAYDRVMALAPQNAAAHNMRGVVLAALGRPREALASFDKALAIRPLFDEAHFNRGRALKQALERDPDFADGWVDVGNLHCLMSAYQEALRSYDRALAIDAKVAGRDFMLGRRLHSKMQLCDWTDFDADCDRIRSEVSGGHRVIDPFVLATIPSSPLEQLACARMRAAQCVQAVPRWRGERYAHDRIRIAYLSDSFRDHPISHLLAGVIECHDQSRFEVTCISTFKPSSLSEEDRAVRARLEAGCRAFIQAGEMEDDELARLLHERKTDIAVDLMGHTGAMRLQTFAQRPAPVQVNFLGFPGTSGAPFIDYIIADRVLIPEDERKFYSEKVVYLPDTYQPNDRGKRISEELLSKQDSGLPQSGFVFCCFNQIYKITPAVFEVWMRLLREIPESVLWLRASQPETSSNLRREAERRGVSPDRLVFAPRQPLLSEHLARHRLADLFLDTVCYNAHTTASDALWAGLPVLTCAGSTFAGRVAASLLSAIGLPELIARNLDEYETIALRLARDAAALTNIKRKLASNRDSFPLFDTNRYTRNIEAAFIRMWERYRRGELPDHLT